MLPRAHQQQKGMTQKDNSVKSTSEGGQRRRNDDKNSHQSDRHDNPVIEKTVVMLENPSIPVVHAYEEKLGDAKGTEILGRNQRMCQSMLRFGHQFHHLQLIPSIGNPLMTYYSRKFDLMRYGWADNQGLCLQFPIVSLY